jgi:hypothetical protein
MVYWRPSRSFHIPAICSVDTIEFYAAWVLSIASKCWMVPRQKGHNGCASPRAHSWYAHCLHRLCWQPLMATSSPESMQMGHICKAHTPVSMHDHSRRHPCQQRRLTHQLQEPPRQLRAVWEAQQATQALASQKCMRPPRPPCCAAGCMQAIRAPTNLYPWTTGSRVPPLCQQRVSSRAPCP